MIRLPVSHVDPNYFLTKVSSNEHPKKCTLPSIYEPHHERTRFLPVLKQRCRIAVQLLHR